MKSHCCSYNEICCLIGVLDAQNPKTPTESNVN